MAVVALMDGAREGEGGVTPCQTSNPHPVALIIASWGILPSRPCVERGMALTYWRASNCDSGLLPTTCTLASSGTCRLATQHPRNVILTP